MRRIDVIGGRECTLYSMDGTRILLVQPVDSHDRSLLDNEVELIRSLSEAPFNLVAFTIKDWMSELTPWPAPPTFGKQSFGDGAEATLNYLKETLLPYTGKQRGDEGGPWRLFAGWPLLPLGGIQLLPLRRPRCRIAVGVVSAMDRICGREEDVQQGCVSEFGRQRVAC